MNRRLFLSNFLYAASFSGLFPLINIKKLRAEHHGKVVVIGGGWGGLSTAKTIKLLSPEVEVIVIEKEKVFRSCPISNWVIGQIKIMDDITFSYETLTRQYDIKFIHEKASYIDIEKKVVTTETTSINYDKLVLSPGVELDYSSVENWNSSYSNVFPAAWKAGRETELLA